MPQRQLTEYEFENHPNLNCSAFLFQIKEHRVLYCSFYISPFNFFNTWFSIQQLIFKMSEILITSHEEYQDHFEINQLFKVQKTQSYNHYEEYAKFDSKLLKYLQPHREFTQVTTLEDTRFKKYTVLFQKIARNYNGLLSFVYNKLQAKATIFFHLLDLKGNFFKLPTSAMLISFAKSGQLAEKNSQLPLKLMVNYNSLEVFFQVIYFSPSKSNLIYDMQRTRKHQNIILAIYKNFIQRNLSVIQNALDIVAPLQCRKEEEEQKRLVQNLYRYATLMTMKSNFLVGEIVSEQTRSKNLKEREQSGRNLYSKKIYIESETLKSLQLFCRYKLIKNEKGQKNKNQLYISGAEEKVIKKEITFQIQKAVQETKKNYETFLNAIKIFEPQKLVTFKLDQGGFSQLFLSDLKFQMVESLSHNFQAELDTKSLINKVLVVKKQSKQNGKIIHQTRILSQLKSMYIPFLAKYYLPLNLKNNPIDKNPLLIMEMLIHGNLADFMKKNRKSTSLKSKLILMFSLTIALRVLDKFKVVHLDLKPGNIMMSSNLSIKIIDFGEAYHQQVFKLQGANYKPGITLPYSPPEALAIKNVKFTSKSDFFSLGVIFYELMFDRRPFENMSDFFLSPEQCDNFGETLIVRVLNWVISRCLSRNPEDRPELEWISMILKICMYLVT